MSINKLVTGECHNCESVFVVQYNEMLSSKEYPEYCPFCGEPIEELSEEEIDDYIDEEDDLDDSETWH